MKFDYIIEFNNVDSNGVEYEESKLAFAIINIFTTLLTIIGFIGVVLVYVMFKQL